MGLLFDYVDLEMRIPARHRRFRITVVVKHALPSLEAGFDRLSMGEGRPSVAPQRSICHRQGIAQQCPERRARPPQLFCAARPERQLMEQTGT